jgi:hypothetical protein
MSFVTQSECCQGLAIEVICHGKESDSDPRRLDHWRLAKMNHAQAHGENQNYPNAGQETTTEPSDAHVTGRIANNPAIKGTLVRPFVWNAHVNSDAAVCPHLLSMQDH